jgi:hypothetical protein
VRIVSNNPDSVNKAREYTKGAQNGEFFPMIFSVTGIDDLIDIPLRFNRPPR